MEMEKRKKFRLGCSGWGAEGYIWVQEVGLWGIGWVVPVRLLVIGTLGKCYCRDHNKKNRVCWCVACVG